LSLDRLTVLPRWLIEIFRSASLGWLMSTLTSTSWSCGGMTPAGGIHIRLVVADGRSGMCVGESAPG
jgi:hypothetical protein